MNAGQGYSGGGKAGSGQTQRRGGGGGRALGPGGDCVCPKCGEKSTHQRGQPCSEIKCPKCGSPMSRA